MAEGKNRNSGDALLSRELRWVEREGGLAFCLGCKCEKWMGWDSAVLKLEKPARREVSILKKKEEFCEGGPREFCQGKGIVSDELTRLSTSHREDRTACAGTPT